MSDELPFHIQEAILKRLPIKSLIQFRSVSRTWKSLIDSSEFIAAHNVSNTQPQHLFVWYTDTQEDKYVSFVDDDSFPQHRFVPSLPLSIRLPKIVGSSYGLLCFQGYEFSVSSYRKMMAVLLNPSIRKSIAIALPDMLHTNHKIVLGFGVCPVTIDTKVIQITQMRWSWRSEMKSEIGNFWEVMVYKLTSGKFTSLSSNLPSISIHIIGRQVVIDRYIYWCAVDCTTVDSVLKTRNLIMSFDLTNESFEVIELPDRIAILHLSQFSVSKLRESLVLLEYSKDGYDIFNEEQLCCTVWMVEHGVERSFTKLFTIEAPGDLMRAVGFRRKGGPIMEVQDYIFESTEELVVYEPNSEQSNHLISGSSFIVNSYIETLVLLGSSDCCSY
ncbi:unnamed protein product [Lactuca saligna]|uniref:F-box domain-containing protein n=1 Tax=Lactuca saligna TaxID=75948 RepID=A0AA35YED8_LACSI|nr:unnamed protein product [Lactuca saligna]CAI9270544.1 unnamed protein product [Lactuca saligna]